jgi:hypothetical protein
MMELPPILTGTPQQQINQLREYLLRLVRQLEEENHA